MRKIDALISRAKEARDSYCERILPLSETQAQWKPSPDAWNIVEITEHLYWAEQGGIAGMWKTIHAIRSGQMGKHYDSVHQNLRVEEIIARTWKEKETVPPVAAPRQGGTLIFWRYALSSLQQILEGFAQDLNDDELHIQAHPHPISGPMDFQQRLEFLAFHLNRHEAQVKNLQQLYAR